MKRNTPLPSAGYRHRGRTIVRSRNGGYSIFERYGMIGGTLIVILLVARLAFLFLYESHFFRHNGQQQIVLGTADQRAQQADLATMNDMIVKDHWMEAYHYSQRIDTAMNEFVDHPGERAVYLLPIDQLGQQALQDYMSAGGTAIRQARESYSDLWRRHPSQAYNVLKAVEPQADQLASEDPAAQNADADIHGWLANARTHRDYMRYMRNMQAQEAAHQRMFLQLQPAAGNGFHPANMPPQNAFFHPATAGFPAQRQPTTSAQTAPPPPPMLSPEDQALFALRSNPVYVGANHRAAGLIRILGRQLENARTPWRGIADRTHTAAELLGIYVNLRSLVDHVPLNAKIDDQMRQLNGHLSVQNNPIEGSILGVRSQRNILAIWAALRAKKDHQFATEYRALGAAGKWKILAPAPIPQVQADYARDNQEVLAMFRLAFAGPRTGGVSPAAGPTLFQPRVAAMTAAQQKAMIAQRKILQVLLQALAQRDNAIAQIIANKVNGAVPSETSPIVVQEDYLQGIVWSLQYLIRDL